MLAFVAHEARMRLPADKEGKVSTRTALEAAARRGVQSAIAVLHGPELPEPMAYLWEWFTELDRARTVGFNGANPVTYPDIDAWARLTGRTPTPAEVRMLLEIDIVMRHPEVYEETKAEAGRAA